MKRHEKHRSSKGADAVFEEGMKALNQELVRRLDSAMGKFTGRVTEALKALHERLEKLD